MRTSDSALESLNIIFFDLEILGTTWVPSGWPICTWNKPKTSFLGKPTNDFFRSQNYRIVPKISKFLWSKSMMPQLSKTVSTVLIWPLAHFLQTCKNQWYLPFFQGWHIWHIIWTNIIKFKMKLKNDLEVICKQSTRFGKVETSYFLIIEISKFLGTMR